MVFNLISFDTNLLGSYYAVQSLQNAVASARAAGFTAGSSNSAVRSPAVLTPWDHKNPNQSESRRLRDALSGDDFIKLTGTSFDRADVPKSHKNLFALYKALGQLSTLAEHAAKDDTVSGFLPGLDRRFQAGFSEINTFVDRLNLTDVQVIFGDKSHKVESEIRIPRDVSKYGGPVINTGTFDDLIAGVAGDEVFTISVEKLTGTPDVYSTNVNIDLSLMADPLTGGNIIGYINTQLEAADIISRVRYSFVGQNAHEEDQFATRIEGSSTEVLSFSAAVTNPALYVASSVGLDDTATGQVTKLNDISGASPTVGFTESIETKSATTDARASVIDSDGDLYVVGNSTGDLGSQVLRGTQDVYLTKYDSAGSIVWTRLLGAGDKADGFSLALDSADNIIIGGKVRGDLTTTAIGGAFDSFVTKYDSLGQEVFTFEQGSLADDEILDITVDASDNIFVSGVTSGQLAGTETYAGGRDAFITKLDSAGTLVFNRQFGTSGDERASAIAVASDGNPVVAVVESGSAFLRKYDATDPSAAVLWEIDLGSLDGGALTDIAVNGTEIYLTGSATNAALDAGGAATILNAHSGNTDGFLFRADDAGGSATANFTTYIGSTEADRVNAITVSGGDIYVAGQTKGSLPGETLAGTQDGFVSKFNNAGTLQFHHQYGGSGGVATGNGISVDAQGDSVLDKLGLPKGTLVYNSAKTITAATSARAGDSFFIAIDGKKPTEITIDIDDDLDDLIRKINRVIVFDGKADESFSSLGNKLRIAVSKIGELEILPGPGGSNLLQSLNLNATILFAQEAEPADDAPLSFGLNLKSGLSLLTQDNAKNASSAILRAMSAIRRAFRELTTPPGVDDPLAGIKPKFTGAQAARLANMQTALSGLLGFSTSTSA